MRAASIAELKSNIDEFIEASANGPILVTRNRKPVAVLFGSQNKDDIERMAMAHSPKLRAILNRSYSQIQAGQVIPHDEFWAQMDALYKARKHRGKAALRSSARNRAR